MEKQTENSNHLGGRPTLRPPTNVVSSFTPYQILSSGIDTFVLSIDVEWLNSVFFAELDQKKTMAEEENLDQPFTMPLFAETKEEWKTVIKPHGAKGGYRWVLIGKDFSFRIGNWLKPTHQPSMMVEIHSEALWRIGLETAIETITLLIRAYGGNIVSIKPSRIDLCLDMLMPSNEWNTSLLKNVVTRAGKASSYFDLKRKKLEGIFIGKGKAVVKARIYDKALEILQQSKKEWMYDVWNIEQVPDGYNVIRVEFQLRRVAIKELGINQIQDFFKVVHNLWAYCSERWLNFSDNPGKHHSLRSLLPWWKSVQEGFHKIQEATPLIRCKAFQADEKQLFDQTYGLIRSMKALRLEKGSVPEESNSTLLSTFLETFDIATVYGKTDDQFKKDVEEKRSKYQRLRDKLKKLENIKPPSPNFAGGSA